ncbi:MAG: hypothetical protein LBR83_08345 [Clostridiales bacterium]|jgi:hypothetical protein|nr:hypothetical protein [Clostridiales bacterium]
MKNIKGSAVTLFVFAVCLSFFAPCVTANGQENAKNAAMPVIREDEEGLVQVRVEGGEASISFDLERWDALYDIYGIDTENWYEHFSPEGMYFIVLERLSEGPFPINADKVKDACVGQIAEISSNFAAPAVFLLMEDGTVEWLMADIYAPCKVEDSWDVFTSRGKLPWLKGITSLSLENDGEGIGETTIYATDGSGLRYDLRIPFRFENLCDAPWVCDVVADDIAELQGRLRFEEDGAVYMEVSTYGGAPVEKWSGSFYVELPESTGLYKAGSIVFDLALDWRDEDPARAGNRHQIKGVYHADKEGGYSLNLSLNTGDALFSYSGDYPSYSFWQDYWRNYVEAEELTVYGIKAGTTREGLVEKLGQPKKKTPYSDSLTGAEAEVYDYGNVRFYLAPAENAAVVLAEINGMTAHAGDTPRYIQVGDMMEDCIFKFPNEYDFSENASGLIYGKEPADGAWGGSARYTAIDFGVSSVIRVVSEKYGPELLIYFDEEISEYGALAFVNRMQIFYEPQGDFAPPPFDK